MTQGFPTATREEWLRLVEGVLKGAPYDTRMVTRTLDGVVLDALPPRRTETSPVAGREAGTRWKIIARIEHPDPAQANAQALEDLEGGADGLALIFASAPSAQGFGLPESVPAIDTALEGVMIDLIPLRIEAGRFRARDIALAVAALVERQRLVPSMLDIRFGLDPIGDFAALGSAPIAWDGLSARLGQTVAALRERGFRAPMVRADGRIHHAAGATDAQELAGVLATLIAYLRALEATGLALPEAAGMLEATLTADVEQFATTAKLRALRLIWARALEACGIDPVPLAIHAETAWRSLTRHDAQVNLLRGTIAAFAAGTGGADSLTVQPFTAALGLPDGFARRLARNTQLILMEEANLHRVADPGAGSGTVEEHTDGLAATAWELFRRVEREGGMVTALESGFWHSQVDATRSARAKEVATRKRPITGTSAFPLLSENVPSVLAPLSVQAAPPPAEGALLCEPLLPHRLAEPFESLRAAAAQASPPPQIFLASFGPATAFGPRADFARGLFESGGLATPNNAGFDSADAMLAAFRASGAAVACLCASDEVYGTAARAYADALRGAGAKAVWLAGRLEAAPDAAIDGAVFAGCDAIAALQQLHRQLGLRPR